jgi:urate oxidase / 2-oxo-4-hydroxy-4-carboxy-5-ureidoimidazoline decarboxylase
VEQFASGSKQHYYGKGDVIVYRLHRGGGRKAKGSPVFGANVLMLTYGDAFWPTYASGDNKGLVATDSMKNFIQRETLNFPGDDLAQYCRFLGSTFLEKYPQAEGVQVTATEIPYAGVDGELAFAPAGPERAMARVEMSNEAVLEAVAGLHGFRLMRLGGSAFTGFVRDEYTTLPEVTNRPLHMWLDLEWRYIKPDAAFAGDDTVARVREIVRDVFRSFESGSIQQLIHQMGTKMLDRLPMLSEIHLEADNRTWDTITERGDEIGVFTDPRPPYGCLGLRLTR